MEIVDRINLLREKLFSGNLTMMSNKVGISRQMLSTVLHGHITPSEKLKSQLVNTLNINRAWLESGIGEMLQESPPHSSNSFVIPDIEKLSISEMRELLKWFDENHEKLKSIVSALDK